MQAVVAEVQSCNNSTIFLYIYIAIDDTASGRLRAKGFIEAEFGAVASIENICNTYK